MSKIIITPLGTVSPYPKVNTNCPGFLVEYNDKKILLDCGNGITKLLKLPEDLNNLYVFISHYHKDHFGDLGAIQYASYVFNNLGKLNKKIKVFIPKNDFAYNRLSIVENKESFCEYYDIDNGTTIHIDDLTVTFEDNHSHTIESYMIKLQNDEFKVVYTSDIGTTNKEQLERFCQNADLIICESSFLRKHNSNSQTHMTAYAAGTLAKNANAKQLLLTHFWPDEPKSLYVEEAKETFTNVDAAEEGKRLILERKPITWQQQK